MTSMDVDMSKYYSDSNFISIKEMIKDLSMSGIKEIEDAWKDAPFRYRLKFKFKRKQIVDFIEKEAKKVLFIKDKMDTEKIRGFFFIVNYAYSFFLVSGLKDILPPFFKESEVMSYVAPAIAEMFQKYKDSEDIRVLIWRKEEIASLAIKMYNESQIEEETQINEEQ